MVVLVVSVIGILQENQSNVIFGINSSFKFSNAYQALVCISNNIYFSCLFQHLQNHIYPIKVSLLLLYSLYMHKYKLDCMFEWIFPTTDVGRWFYLYSSFFFFSKRFIFYFFTHCIFFCSSST